MNERYRLLIEAGPSSTPAITRLRAALKCLLRSFGLRAIELRELTELTESTVDASDSTQTASKAKDDDSIEAETQRDIRNAGCIKRSRKKTENGLSGAE